MARGLEQLPKIFSRPIWRDRFFWILIGTALGWTILLGWIFF